MSRAQRSARTRGPSAVLALLLLAPGLVAPTAASAAPERERDVDVVAHRGSSGVAPENTLAATRAALRHKADVVEIDVQRSADGELVLMHDTTLARTTDVEEVFPDRAPYRVGDFTLAEIRRLDAGSWFAAEYAGEPVPTLEEWVGAVGRRAGMLIEVKAPELYPGIGADLDKELRSLVTVGQALKAGDVVVQSFDHTWLRGYADLAPDVPVGLLFGGNPSDAALADAAGWAEQANPALGAVSASDVDRIHSFGLEVHVWTVNGGRDMRRAVDWGVDGVITNYPQVLRDLLR